jgi:hypothetical protein
MTISMETMEKWPDSPISRQFGSLISGGIEACPLRPSWGLENSVN